MPATLTNLVRRAERLLSTSDASSCPADFPTPSALAARFASRLPFGFAFPPHIQAIEREVMALFASPTRNRLLVSMPPRHGKSYFLSFVLPLWRLLTKPGARVMLASHTATLAEDFGGELLEAVRRIGPRLGVRIDKRHCRRSQFRLEAPHAGRVYTTSAMGSPAGRGVDLFVGDDLSKNTEAVNSPVQRKRLADWFAAEARTRLEPGGKLILVETMRHPEDLTNSMLATNEGLTPDDPRFWHHLSMPAISTDDSGAEHALWPQRYSLDALHALRDDYAAQALSHVWETLFQQEPAGDPTTTAWGAELFEGMLFAPRVWNDLDQFTEMRLLSLDPSLGGKTGDFQAWMDCKYLKDGTVWVMPDLLRVGRGQMEDLTVEKLAANRYDGAVIEGNGFQVLVIDAIDRKCRERRLHAPLHKWTSTGDKHAKIRTALSPLLERRRLRVADTNGGRLLMAQLRGFPGRYDDGPDSLTLNLALRGTLRGARK